MRKEGTIAAYDKAEGAAHASLAGPYSLGTPALCSSWDDLGHIHSAHRDGQGMAARAAGADNALLGRLGSSLCVVEHVNLTPSEA